MREFLEALRLISQLAKNLYQRASLESGSGLLATGAMLYVLTHAFYATMLFALGVGMVAAWGAGFANKQLAKSSRKAIIGRRSGRRRISSSGTRDEQKLLATRHRRRKEDPEDP